MNNEELVTDIHIVNLLKAQFNIDIKKTQVESIIDDIVTINDIDNRKYRYYSISKDRSTLSFIGNRNKDTKYLDSLIPFLNPKVSDK